MGQRSTGRFLLLLVSIIICLDPCGAVCNRYSGPAGGIECIPAPGLYIGKQWATCLTDSYIRQKSDGHHVCADSTITYCYYQCMLESYGKESGIVVNECLCDTGMTPPPHISTTSSGTTTPALPSWCFSPSGSECNWYRECLEARYPCEKKSVSYAITYAEKFCSLYSEALSRFSDTGQKWVNAVRKCLQVALVPLLRPYMSPTCQDIKNTAFGSHTGCYLAPYPEAPSICELPLSDFWEVFWTIKSAFRQAFDASMKGVLETMMGCSQFYTDKIVDGFNKTIHELPNGMKNIILKVQKSVGLRKRSTESDVLDTFAGEVTDAVATQLQWNQQVVSWFSFVNETEIDPSTDIVPVTIFLADSGLYVSASGAPTSNMDRIVEEFADAVGNGTLKIRLSGSKHPITIIQLEACGDMQCIESYLNVTAPPPTPSGAGRLLARVAYLDNYCTWLVYVVLSAIWMSHYL